MAGPTEGRAADARSGAEKASGAPQRRQAGSAMKLVSFQQL
ncbi:MAG: hypothetical protein AAGM38_18045 [Pseudomonadota bacterium]